MKRKSTGLLEKNVINRQSQGEQDQSGQGQSWQAQSGQGQDEHGRDTVKMPNLAAGGHNALGGQDALIRVQGLTFAYGQSVILHGLDLAISAGDFLGVIGPNGSGKSTLMGLLSGVLVPGSGAIYLNGRPVHQTPARELALQMAVVPQSTELLYDFTAYEIVAMGRYPYLKRWGKESPADQQIIQQAMEMTGTWEFREKSVQSLSGGERQRVIIARALAQESEVILLDEPTSSLDINYQIEIFDLMRDLHRQGKTIVTICHDLNLASQYCEHLVLLAEGRMYAAGTPEDVVTVKNIRDVYNTEVAISRKYHGRPYVTLLSRRKSGTVEKGGPVVHLVCGGGSGQEALNWLLERGYPLTGGVLNQGDTDWQTLVQNDRQVVEERPFSPIMPETYAELLTTMGRADLVLVTDLPFGPGNLANLEAVLKMSHQGKPVYLLQKVGIAERDFTGGKAQAIYQELLQRGARILTKVEELVEVLAAIARK